MTGEVYSPIQVGGKQMATVSFESELVLKDPEKIKEILAALRKPKDAKIVPASPPKLPKDAGALWFKRSEK